jgi:flagellar biosynthesis/type III secretory pathway M-ring protein FliF/YscJ
MNMYWATNTFLIYFCLGMFLWMIVYRIVKIITESNLKNNVQKEAWRKDNTWIKNKKNQFLRRHYYQSRLG